MAHPTTATPSPGEHSSGRALAVPGAPRAALPLASVGHLVPQGDFRARVHSVFARACNLQVGAELVAIGASNGGDGPLHMRLSAGCSWDLRRLFGVGEPMACRNGVLQSQRAQLVLRGVAVWRPGVPPPLLNAEVIADNAGRAAALLRQRRLAMQPERSGADSRLLGTAGAGPEGATPALIDATRCLDAASALPALWRLVGWGEGLTPSGDDFIAGWLAALQRLAGTNKARQDFADAVSAAVEALAHRTTPIAAQMLRLAARGEHGSLLLGGRDALLVEADAPRRDTAWQALLALGAGSGADLAEGLLAATQAWTEAPAR